MTTRAQVIAEARTWLRTPFREQHRAKGYGVDCWQFPLGVCIDLGLIEPDAEQRRGLPIGYSHVPGAVDMVGAVSAVFERIAIAEIQAGDLVIVRAEPRPTVRGPLPLHIAIVADHPQGLSVIHANLRGVIEHHLSPAWRKAIVHAFRFPGITE